MRPVNLDARLLLLRGLLHVVRVAMVDCCVLLVALLLFIDVVLLLLLLII